VTGTPISYATLSDLIQRCLEADEAMEVVARSGVGHVAWCHAAAAHDQIQSLLAELRVVAETGDEP